MSKLKYLIGKAIGDKLKHKILKNLRYSGFFQQEFNSRTSSRAVKKYTKTNLAYSPIVKKILKRNNSFYDKYLLNRSPTLVFEQKNGRMVVQLDNNYLPESEIRIDNRPYEALYDCLFALDEFRKVKKFIDIGCSSGNLIELVSKNFPEIECIGIEAFMFLKNAAPKSIAEKIFIEDLRFSLVNKIPKSELAVCLEVAEHIDPNSLDDFINNLKQLTNRYLVMSWSASYPPMDAPPQHLAPIRKFQFVKVMKKFGFREDKNLTSRLKKIAKSKPYFHSWWLESITVWEK